MRRMKRCMTLFMHTLCCTASHAVVWTALQSEAYVGSFNEYTGVGKCINCGATLGLSGHTAF